MSGLVELKVPDIGAHDVNVAEVYIKVGDKINKDDNLLMLETDKATMEVPATSAGIIKEVLVKVNSKVNEGDVIVRLESVEETSNLESTSSTVVNQPEINPSTNPIMAKETKVAATDSRLATEDSPIITQVELDKPQSQSETRFDEVLFSKAYAGPSVRKLARELGADLGKVTGSGSRGRITDKDVKEYVKSLLSGTTLSAQPTSTTGAGLDLLPWPKVDFAKFGEVEVKELARIKKISGANMARNWVMIPHVTHFDEADITELEEFRKQLNEEYKKSEIKITPLAFLIKASVFALKKFRELNASIDGDNLIYKNYYNIGFAADTPQGLVVPVLKDADKKGIVDIANETSALAKLARDAKLKPADMQGGTFTISSIGGLGGTGFTPIINAPEVAILGVAKSSIKPVWNGSIFIPKLMLPLTLSYDHRIIDGALAAKFTSYLVQVLSDIRRLVL